VTFGGTELSEGYVRIAHPDGQLWLEGGAYSYDGLQFEDRRSSFVAGDPCAGMVCRNGESPTVPATVEFRADGTIALATGQSQLLTINGIDYLAIVLLAVEQGCFPDAEECGGPLGQAFLIQAAAQQ